MFALLKETLLKEKAAGNIHHDLAGALKGSLEDSDLFLCPGSLQCGVANDRFTEDAGRLRQGHRRVALQGRALSQVQVMVAMA